MREDMPPQRQKVVYDDFDIINNYKYKIALPAPSFYGQFNNIDNLGIIIEGLKNLGFDEVSKVAVGGGTGNGRHQKGT